VDLLNVQVHRIHGDLAELLFNPREADLRVGETLTLRERDTGRSVIVQVIAFHSAIYPSLVRDQLHSLIGPEPIHAPLLEAIGFQLTLHVPPYKTGDETIAGFWALEFKTAAASEFDKVKAAGIPKEEHARQAQIYLWGIGEYYRGAIPLKGAIIYYENRDTLEHIAYEVYPDPEAIADLLARVKAMLAALAEGRLPDDTLPLDHWAHAYCP